MTVTTILGGQILGQGGQRFDSGPPFGTSLTISGEFIGNPAGSDHRSGHVIDADGLIVSPGFIDLQINGGFGIDLVSDPEGMWELGARLPQHGVTGFLPTIITSPPRCTAAAIRALDSRPKEYVGADPFGLHFEGPMLSQARPGAHPVPNLAPADPAVIADWSRRAGVALVTIAPELANAPTIIGELTGRRVTVSAGHSEASAEQANAGFAAGITLVTHLFNAMSPLGHRDPNLVGVALARADIATSVIVDGVHVAPEVVAAAWNAKGPDGFVVITDAVAPMGMGPGTYRLGEVTTRADEREVRTSDGVLAGSILTMDQALRNLMAFTGCDPGEALLAATTTPARVIGETARGRIETGGVADLVLLDQDLVVQATMCRGRVAYLAESARGRVTAGLLEGV